VVVDRGPRYYDRGPRYHDGYYRDGYYDRESDRGYYGDRRRSTTVVVEGRPGYYAPARSGYNRTVVRGGYQPVRAGYHTVPQRPGTTVVVKKRHGEHD